MQGLCRRARRRAEILSEPDAELLEQHVTEDHPLLVGNLSSEDIVAMTEETDDGV